jgi:NitT/TauT family transport system substrate-binding protein
MKIVRIAAAAASLVLAGVPALAQEKLTYISTWRAQAEHGGYYQAVARGYYKACGVDLTIRPAGPGVNPQQLFAAGAVDIMMASHSEVVLQLNQQGFASKAVMAVFQKNPQILMTHAGNGIEKIEDMKGKPIMISPNSKTTYWAFLKTKYGFTDEQIRPYSGQIAPWLVDNMAISQAFVTNEPYRVEKETGKAPKVFMLSDLGWGSYASISIFPQKLIDTKPQAVQCFVDASKKGWQEFLNGDASPGIALIKKDNPDNPDDVIDSVIKTLKARGIVESGDVAAGGIGAMTDQRWKDFVAMQVQAGLIPAGFDYRSAFTTQFLKK